MLAALSAACGGGDSNGATTQATDDDAGDAANDDAGDACTANTALAVTGSATAIPGQPVTLAASGAGSDTITWTATSGAFDATTGTTVKWTPALTSAAHKPEKATITATDSSCGGSATLTVTIDWPDPLRTLVLYNPSAQGSEDVAKYYAAFRAIPDDHLCAADYAKDTTTMDGADYPAWLATVLACAAKVGPHVHYIAATWGVPYKVSNRIHDLSGNGNFATVSLDALLVYGGQSTSLTDSPVNPLYQNAQHMAGKYDPYVPFGPWRAKQKNDYFLVTRIDGAGATASKALVDRAKAAADLASQGKLDGIVYVDGNKGLPHPSDDTFGSYNGGEWSIIGVENVMKAYGKYTVTADYNGAEFGTAPAPFTCPSALYYAGWYSFGHYNAGVSEDRPMWAA